MGKFSVIVLIFILSLIAFNLWYPKKNIATQNISPSPTNIAPQEAAKKISDMKIASVFASGEEIPLKFTCKGENINPPLYFLDIPEDAKSLSLIVDDPDAPAGTWTHWLLWNINPKTSEIRENSVPESAIQGKTSSGKNKYSGPCPPSGTHRYFFKLYALDTDLDLSQNSDKKDLEKEMENHIVSQAELVGTYSKK